MLACFGRAMTHLGDDRHGATLLEYGLIAALIAIVCIGSASTIGADLRTIFGNVLGSL